MHAWLALYALRAGLAYFAYRALFLFHHHITSSKPAILHNIRERSYGRHEKSAKA